MFKKSLEDMFTMFRVKDENLFNVYYKKLKKSGFDEKEIKKRIDHLTFTYKPEYGNKIPVLSEIIGYNEEIEHEEAWNNFKETYVNTEYTKKISSMVLSIREYLGGLDYIDQEIYKDGGKWLKKEFIPAYKLFKTGKMRILEDSRVFVPLLSGNGVAVLPANCDPGKLIALQKDIEALPKEEKQKLLGNTEEIKRLVRGNG